MTLWKEIKNQFRKPTPLEVATAELVEAELEKLVDETAREHAEASVSYNNARMS